MEKIIISTNISSYKQYKISFHPTKQSAKRCNIKSSLRFELGPTYQVPRYKSEFKQSEEPWQKEQSMEDNHNATIF